MSKNEMLSVARWPCQKLVDSSTVNPHVYGGTSAAIAAAIAAAVQLKRMGKSVIVVGPDKHLAGLTAGGLGWTDSGNKEVIGGISREFYQRIRKIYDRPETWKWQTSGEYNRYRGGGKLLKRHAAIYEFSKVTHNWSWLIASNDRIITEGILMFSAADQGLAKSQDRLGNSVAGGYLSPTKPAIADGRLIFRMDDKLVCFDLRASGATAKK